ncbi:MAG: hypothetical protein E7H36_12425, partial [Bifidobacterium dentium]|nr:hypothetical protein [Bifidobacterium dentium]
ASLTTSPNDDDYDREAEIEKRPVMPGEAQKGRADITGRRYVRATGNYLSDITYIIGSMS